MLDSVFAWQSATCESTFSLFLSVEIVNSFDIAIHLLFSTLFSEAYNPIYEVHISGIKKTKPGM